MITICYFLEGPGYRDPVDSLAHIEAEDCAPVGILKGKLMERHPVLGKSMRFKIWKLHSPANMEEICAIINEQDFSRVGTLMLPLQRLSTYGDWPEGKIHLVVNFFPLDDKNSRPLSIMDTTALLPHNTYSATRKTYLENELPQNPSSSPSEFLKYQQCENPPFLCNRPPEAVGPIPITLLHPIFGRFLDLCGSHQPTAQDNELALKISTAMSEFYTDDDPRSTQFSSILREYGFNTQDDSDGYSSLLYTDEQIWHKNFMIIIIEAKNEIGGGEETDPFIQAIYDYGNFLRGSTRPWQYPSVLPCFHIILFGSCVAFSASAFTSKIHADTLGPIIPLSAHPADRSIRELTAQTFGALRVTLNELQNYYSGLLSDLKIASLNTQNFSPDCPYPKSYRDLSGKQFSFIYNNEQPRCEQRIFFARARDGNEICLKFVKQYSPELHQFCAEKGHAPKILGYESLTGGWRMVVMEVLPISTFDKPLNSYRPFYYRLDQPLRSVIEAFVKDLHDNKFVHGDLRGLNFFVKNDSNHTNDFMLLDFDWGGVIGAARYPMCVNREQVDRPAGAVDGELILPEHDLEMIEYMFRY